jgi:hypothetical protein
VKIFGSKRDEVSWQLNNPCVMTFYLTDTFVMLTITYIIVCVFLLLSTCQSVEHLDKNTADAKLPDPTLPSLQYLPS